MYRFLYINVSQLWKAHEHTHTRTCEHNGQIAMQRLAKLAKYAGGLVCTFGGVYLGNAYGAGYWRFGPLNLAWDTIFRNHTGPDRIRVDQNKQITPTMNANRCIMSAFPTSCFQGTASDMIMAVSMFTHIW